MDCEFNAGHNHCILIDAVFQELSIGLPPPECPFCYSWRNTREDCPIYRAAGALEQAPQPAPDDPNAEKGDRLHVSTGNAVSGHVALPEGIPAVR